MTNEIKVALIAALSALAGSAIGGYVSYATSKDLQNREFARSRREQLTQARAASALESARFRLASDTVAVVLHDHLATSVGGQLESIVTAQEQKLIASYMTRSSV